MRYYCIALPIGIISALVTAILEQIPIFNTAVLIILLKYAVDCVLFIASYLLQKKWVFKTR